MGWRMRTILLGRWRMSFRKTCRWKSSSSPRMRSNQTGPLQLPRYEFLEVLSIENLPLTRPILRKPLSSRSNQLQGQPLRVHRIQRWDPVLCQCPGRFSQTVRESNIPRGKLLTGPLVQDENLKRLMMSWYFAGYYTGLYEGQQQAQPKT